MSLEAWVGAADRALALATDQVRLIRALTPRNADAELERMTHDFRRGARRLPQWQYDAPRRQPELLPALERLADHLERIASPLATIYAARARELACETSMVEAVGTSALAGRAALRFLGTSTDDRAVALEAHQLALDWATAARRGGEARAEHERSRERDADVALVRSCDVAHPESLVSVMSREAGRAHLPVRVIVQGGLASLAATGDGFILVAENRWISARATARTVLHEIAGHALPGARAAREPLRLHVLATARGVDDQEGRALLIERAAGFLDGERSAELGLRHLGAELALSGATFIETVDLLTAYGALLPQALRIAARVHRGGAGTGGLGREVVYLTALLRVERARADGPPGLVESVMSCGRIAAAVAPAVAEVTKQARRGVPDLRRLGPFDTL